MSTECVKCGSRVHGCFPCQNCGCELPPILTGQDAVIAKLQAENDRLTAEVARLKCGLWQSKDHRIGLLKESFENIVDNYSNFDCRRWRSMMTDIIKIAKAALEI